MFVFDNISFDFGGQSLYSETSLHIKPDERIGLIGANGSGKSTLLRLLTGEYSTTGGKIQKRKDLSIAFLNQDHLSYQSESPILDVAMQAFEVQNKLLHEIEEMYVLMETDHSEETLHLLADKQHKLEALDGYNLKHKTEKVLEGLGFSTRDLQRPLNEFSGGYRMRVMLAQMLLQQPDMLLLDEPTNHLDLPSIIWLEEYLTNYPNTVIIVSHDRYFLDNTVTRIVEIENQQFNSYQGTYTFFKQEKAEQIELQKNRFANQQAYIKQQEKFIERFRAKNTKAKAVQSRIKALDRLERVEDVAEQNEVIKISFHADVQPGKLIAMLDVESKNYPGVELFKKSHVEISRGDKIALIGANGRGKSTLLRLLDGSESFEGKLTVGHNVLKTFYAQHQLEALDVNNTVLLELQKYAPELNDTSLRTLLGAFLFKSDDVFKKINVLSGGERSRLALAKVMLAKANFLLLDEPTNHLDIPSVNMLVQVLQKTENSFVVVSHDRYFLSAIANKIWYIEDGVVKEYPGDYEEYELWAEQRKKLKQENSSAAKAKVKEQKKKGLENNDRDRKKESQNAMRTLQKDLDGYDTKIKQKKKDLLQLQSQLAEPALLADYEKTATLGEVHNKLEAEIKQLTQSWEKCFEQLANLENED